MRRILLTGLAILWCAAMVRAQGAGDVLGMHNLGPGSKSPITGSRTDSCSYCHAPHSATNVGLWNQKLTTQTYTMYKSNTEKNTGIQPKLASASNMCLSCHDGTVAVGDTVAYGKVTTVGVMNDADIFKGQMQTQHPFSLAPPLKDNVHLVSTLASNGKTGDTSGAVKLINGSVECTSCHNPHSQAKDTVSQNFLVKDSSGGQLCLSCHDPSRTVSAQANPLADWGSSAHATAANKIQAAAHVGSYATVGSDACISCHTPHNAGSGARLLRAQDEQTCVTCHSAPTNVDMPPTQNVLGEYQGGKVGHPFPTSSNPHDATEDALLNNNRHATCVDCHNGHSAQPVDGSPAAPVIRVSQKNVSGINATDGTSVLETAVNQYESCLRCHGTSAGKQTLPVFGYFPVRAVSAGDQLNLIPQFAVASPSSHPVTHPRSSPLQQVSLRPNMMNLDGVKEGRAMGQQIFCSDCHNSDDNREFGGTGPSGPHGSKWYHILERRYEFSTAAQPGQKITNLIPADMSATGPYALCAKCHDLENQIMKDTSWKHHSEHIGKGISCSVCHTAHGMGATSGAISGQRLVNFDLNVVASDGVNPISYVYANGEGTCVLVCHGVKHPAQSVSAVRRTGPVGVK
jgi:predicted CXXCH cytochrome family protein